ncbi:hypothetical protein [Botrimarina sp.]|uniref:hypothetical protein n=1 Tax=Botrimarina sp. TaxID=2795802 RepID=UPI0032ED0D31
MTPADAAPIHEFADANQVVVHVVGSRAAGTARAESDYDYLLGETGSASRLRQKARRELPRGVAGGELHPTRGETGIDVFRDSLDRSLPHVTFTPKGRRPPR